MTAVVWTPLTKEQIKQQEELDRLLKQMECRHDWAHRNDGKVSVCHLCGKVECY